MGTSKKIPDRIVILLQKYYEGSSSIEEERELREFFTGSEFTHESSNTDFNLFSFLSQDVNLMIPNDLLWNHIKEKEKKSKIKLKSIWTLTGIAASLLICISIGTWIYISESNHDKFLAQDSYKNPKDAYRIVQKYLGLVSNKLATAYNEMKPIEKLALPSESIQNIKMLHYGIIQLDRFNKIEETTKKVEKLSILTDYMDINNKFETK